MGVVYKAQDTRLDRPVALKFLSADLTRDLGARERFIQEAKAASALQHPNICTIHDIGETTEGQMFIVMDFYEGETLEKRIDRAPLKIQEMLEISTQLAEGLSTAHDHGIIHRDIKPANVMLTKDGVAKILDFGLAKLAGQTMLTKTGPMMGTIAYMSPEQVRGEQVDTRADIWSLGVVIYEMIARQRPFRSEFEQTLMYLILTENPADFSSLGLDVPEYLSTLCSSCLEKDRSQRPQVMEEVYRILKTQRVTNETPTRHFLKRIRTQSLSLAATLFVVVGILSWFVFKPASNSPPATSAKPRVAILAFQDASNDPEISEWPMLVQTMLVRELTGIEDVGIVDPLSLNGLIESSFGTVTPRQSPDLYHAVKSVGIGYVIDGSFFKVGKGIKIQSNLVNASTGEVRYSCEAMTTTEVPISDAVASLAQKFADFFQVEILRLSDEKNIRPWLSHRTQNIGAIKAFMQASQYIYRMQVGAEEKYLRRAIKLDSSFVAPRVWLISGLMVRGKLQEAQTEYQRILTLESDASPFDQAMINCMGAFVRGDVGSQARYLEIALDYSPGNNILLVNLAYIKYLMGEFQTAIDLIRPVVEMKWHYPPLFTLYARCFLRLGNAKEAKRILLESLSMTPVDPEVYALLSGIREKEQNQEESRRYESQYLSRAFESGYSEASAHDALGSIFFEIELYDRAIEAFKKAIAKDRRVSSFHDKLADSFYKVGKANEALSEYAEALKIDPFETHSLFMMGIIYGEQGQASESIEPFQKILQHDSTSLEAISALEKLRLLQKAPINK